MILCTKKVAEDRRVQAAWKRLRPGLLAAAPDLEDARALAGPDELVAEVGAALLARRFGPKGAGAGYVGRKESDALPRAFLEAYKVLGGPEI